VKLKELIGLLEIAIILIACSIFFYIYANKIVAFDTHVTTQKLSNSIDAEKEIHLSIAETKQLLKVELEKTEHLKRASRSFGRMFKYLAVLLFALGLCQLALTIHIFSNNKHQAPNQAD
jgi:hypothetical protein